MPGCCGGPLAFMPLESRPSPTGPAATTFWMRSQKCVAVHGGSVPTSQRSTAATPTCAR
jgi:hypothetical protein